MVNVSIMEALERQVEQLDPKELAEFRNWFLEFEAEFGIAKLSKMPRLGNFERCHMKFRFLLIELTCCSSRIPIILL